MSVIEVQNLHKRYGDVHAVRGVDLHVEEGEVFALLGPNGAGKSTTVEILEGHRERTSGEVRVLGMDPATAGREYRDRMGIVLQSSGIESELSVREVLELYGSSYRNPRSAAEVLELVGLSDKIDARVKQLSGGQQRRIDLALGIIGSPDVLFLDEPTTGFDPSARRRSWDLVSNLRTLGTTIVLTTHYMDEAQHLADRVAVIVDGQIATTGTPAQLMDASGDTVITFGVPLAEVDPSDPLAGLVGLEAVAMSSVAEAGRVTVRTDRPTAALHVVTNWAVERDLELVDLEVHRPSLEDVYLQLAERSPAAQVDDGGDT